MTKIKVSEASGAALDWMVAKCERVIVKKYKESPNLFCGGGFDKYKPSTDWVQGGPIIARRKIGLDQFKGQPCRAYLGTPIQYEHAMFAPEGQPLIAAMRCYVASKLGDTVEVPEELV